MRDFDDVIKTMRRELRDMKAGAQIAPIVRAYSKTFTTGAGAAEKYPNGHARIYFADGDGDIITDVISDISVTLITPNYGSNTQDFYLLAFTSAMYERAPIIAESTRPILDIKLLD